MVTVVVMVVVSIDAFKAIAQQTRRGKLHFHKGA
jgi:hypothetical protein